MAIEGVEPTSSMGDDTAQSHLVAHSRPIFSFLKQRFAQVTNPPIDHLRERHVMSISTRLGPRDPLLQERAEAPSQLREYAGPLLFPDAVGELQNVGGTTLDATFDASEGPAGLERALERLAAEAVSAATGGAAHIVVSDVGAGPNRVAVPSALASGAVHQALL